MRRTKELVRVLQLAIDSYGKENSLSFSQLNGSKNGLLQCFVSQDGQPKGSFHVCLVGVKDFQFVCDGVTADMHGHFSALERRLAAYHRMHVARRSMSLFRSVSGQHEQTHGQVVDCSTDPIESSRRVVNLRRGEPRSVTDRQSTDHLSVIELTLS